MRSDRDPEECSSPEVHCRGYNIWREDLYAVVVLGNGGIESPVQWCL